MLCCCGPTDSVVCDRTWLTGKTPFATWRLRTFRRATRALTRACTCSPRQRASCALFASSGLVAWLRAPSSSSARWSRRTWTFAAPTAAHAAALASRPRTRSAARLRFSAPWRRSRRGPTSTRALATCTSARWRSRRWARPWTRTRSGRTRSCIACTRRRSRSRRRRGTPSIT